MGRRSARTIHRPRIHRVYSAPVSSTVPPGYRLVPDGQLTQHVTFRVTPEEGEHLLAFRDTFAPAQWATAFRWLINEPRVRAVMRERIEASLSDGS